MKYRNILLILTLSIVILLSSCQEEKIILPDFQIGIVNDHLTVPIYRVCDGGILQGTMLHRENWKEGAKPNQESWEGEWKSEMYMPLQKERILREKEKRVVKTYIDSILASYELTSSGERGYTANQKIVLRINGREFQTDSYINADHPEKYIHVNMDLTNLMKYIMYTLPYLENQRWHAAYYDICQNPLPEWGK